MAKKKSKFTFIDLFAGIGGMRIAFEEVGCKCVFSSEWDKHSQETYKANFGDMPKGDINLIDPVKDIPKYDILVGGFPCPSFSLAGVSKRNSLGMKHGFDGKQGDLFFRIRDILKANRPKAFLLENVKNLVTHDGGNTFRIIRETLEDNLDYKIYCNVIDGKHYVPQHRERIFIVGMDKHIYGDKDLFEFPTLPPANKRVKDILEDNVNDKYTLSDHLWNYLQNYAAKHKEKGNGFGFGLVNLDGVTRTLSARYHKDGSEILIPQAGKNPRKLTRRECARIQGFPEWFNVDVVSLTQTYRQFGNSVVVPVIKDIAESLVDLMSTFENQQVPKPSRKRSKAVMQHE